MKKFKQFDFYRKTPRDLTEPSFFGATMSMVAVLTILLLAGMECRRYSTITDVTSVVVDKSPNEELMLIYLNISFLSLPCELATVDLSDVLGTIRIAVGHTITKYPINTNLQVSGCRLCGFLRVKKVPGNLVISARSEAHPFDSSLINMSHVISAFAFGEKADVDTKSLFDVNDFILKSNDQRNFTVEHYLQVVKKEVLSLSGKRNVDYEYTSHSTLIATNSMPVAKFIYGISPMQVLISESKPSGWQFITNLLAIIGGVYMVAGIVDSLVYNLFRWLKWRRSAMSSGLFSFTKSQPDHIFEMEVVP